MGQRAAHETFITIVGAFVAQKRWTQAALAREAGVSTEAVRKHLTQMKADGWPLQEEKDPPHVVWRMPPNWYPGVLALTAEEVPDLLRLLARSPRSTARERLLRVVHQRLPLKSSGPPFEAAVQAPELSQEEEQWIALLEDAAAKKVAVRMHYTTASRRDDSTRHVSVHLVEVSAYPRFLATCHNSDRLKWFRVAGVSNARLDRADAYREHDAERIAAFQHATVGGFHEEGPTVRCTFFVRQPEAAWVKRNLLRGMKHETASDGIRVTIDTAAVHVVARFVVQLGEAARPESAELADRVSTIAHGALKSITRASCSGRRIT
jgi:predicted DNA-binding transcriptional regulator YafY